MGTDLNPAKKDFRKNSGTTGTGQKCQRRGKTCPVFEICAPKPRKRVPLLYPVPFCPNAFLFTLRVFRFGPAYRNTGNNLLARKPGPDKSAGKNCFEAGSYYSGLVCQTGIMRTGFSAADFRLNRVTRLANTGGY